MSANSYARFPGMGDLPGDSSHPNSPDCDTSREEWIDARAKELTSERMADHGRLADAVEQLIGYSDWTDTLAGDMAAVLGASEAAFDAEAIQFFARLHKRVKTDVRATAECDAESERDRWEDEQGEMRGTRLGADDLEDAA